MIQIKKFIDRVSLADSKKQTSVVMSMEDARYLRDEISKLLVDLHNNESQLPEPTIEVVMTGGKFK
jgi:hypothetical protein